MTNVNRHNACDREKVLALKGIRTEFRHQSLALVTLIYVDCL